MIYKCCSHNSFPMGLQFTNPEAVHPKIYEACLKYTFTFKLAPYWNLIGKSYYLHGSDFLLLPKTIDALDWSVYYNGMILFHIHYLYY